MAAASDILSVRARRVTALIAMAFATAAAAQTAAPPAGTAPSASPPSSASTLNLPQSVQLFGSAMPSVVKATAIINGEVITQTDVDQRLALLAMSQEAPIPPEQLDQLRQQVLRNLIDETLQIQAAKRDEISVKPSDVDRTVARVANDSKRTVQQLADELKAHGSSIRSMRRQIEGEIAWRRVQQSRIESTVSVGDDEVQAVLDRLNAAKGTTEFRVGEIFISSAAVGEQQALASANQILDQLRQGASFAGYARQYSEASTAAVGGDLGWVRPETLPDQLSAVVRQMTPGSVSRPGPDPRAAIPSLPVSRRPQGSGRLEPRDAVLQLKPIEYPFSIGTLPPNWLGPTKKFPKTIHA